MESLRSGVSVFLARISVEDVEREKQANEMARDLLRQVKVGPLNRQSAIEQIEGIEDRDKSSRVLQHFIEFEDHEMGNLSRSL